MDRFPTLSVPGVVQECGRVEVRVSSDLSYTIPADTDLTQQQTYIARFEYRVDYYSVAAGKKIDDYTEPDLHAQRWQRYNSAFVDLPAPSYYKGTFEYWATYNSDASSAEDAYSGNVIDPIKVITKMKEKAGQ